MESVLRADRFEAVVGAVGPQRAAELIAEFHGRLGALLAAVAREAEARDALIARTHQLRGSADTLGMAALRVAIERLEIAISQHDAAWRTNCSREISKVRREHAAARLAATAALPRGSAPQTGVRTSR